MLFAGIDIGSQSTDVVIIDGNKELVSYSIIPSGAVHSETALKAFDIACQQAKCRMEDIAYIVSTGYGRKNVAFAQKNITEITCHVKGTFFLNPNTRTILDIGGQDSKVIKVGPDGSVLDFMMNEKCAAGTGRFLETIARVLGIELKDMGPKALQAKKNVKLSSTCTVFAESEVISKIAEGEEIEDILYGVHDSICDRAIAMLQKLGIEDTIAMTGGVAKNIGVITTLSNRLGTDIYVPNEPQIIGALGAAIFAYEKKNG